MTASRQRAAAHGYSTAYSCESTDESSPWYGYVSEPRGGDTISNCDTSKLERLENDSIDGRECGTALRLFADGGVVLGAMFGESGERTRGGDEAEPDDDTLGCFAMWCCES